MKASRKRLVRARGRLRRAAEILVDDSSLRSNLTDAQAKRLLNWGIELVQTEALRTAGLRDEDALPNLEEKVALTRRAMRSVNRLLGAPGEPADPESAEQIVQLLEDVSRLTGHDTSASQTEWAASFELDRPNLDHTITFDRLMAFLRSHEELGQEEE